jgi:CheY-like chemotaxis protein
MKTTLLVVDDQLRFIELHSEVLRTRPEFKVVTASTLGELSLQYGNHRDELAGIILDGCLEHRYPDTFEFIERVREDRENGTFDGILMAASVDPDYRSEMRLAGCTHEAEKALASFEMLKLLDARTA